LDNFRQNFSEETIVKLATYLPSQKTGLGHCHIRLCLVLMGSTSALAVKYHKKLPWQLGGPKYVGQLAVLWLFLIGQSFILGAQ